MQIVLTKETVHEIVEKYVKEMGIQTPLNDLEILKYKKTDASFTMNLFIDEDRPMQAASNSGRPKKKDTDLEL